MAQQDEDLVHDEEPALEDAEEETTAPQAAKRRRPSPLASMRRLVGQLGGTTTSARETKEQEAEDELRAAAQHPVPAVAPDGTSEEEAAEDARTTMAPAYEATVEAAPEPEGPDQSPRATEQDSPSAYVDDFYARMRERSGQAPS